MKAKRQILSLLLALVMVWQGFSFANAAGSNQDGINLVSSNEEEGAESSFNSAEKNKLNGIEVAANETATDNLPAVTANEDEQSRLEVESSEDDGPSLLDELFESGVEDTEIPAELLALAQYTAGGDELTETDITFSDTTLSFKKEGTAVEENSEVWNYNTLLFSTNFTIKNSVKEKDYFIIQLPKELKYTDTTFPIKNTTDDVIVANAKYDSTTKRLTVTFNDKAKDYPGFKGNLHFSASADESKITNGQKTDLDIKVGNKSIFKREVTYKIKTQEDPLKIWKYNDKNLIEVKDKDGDTHYLFKFNVRIDERNLEKTSASAAGYDNVKLTDTLQGGLSYFDTRNGHSKIVLENPSDADKYAPTITKGIWRSANYENGAWKLADTDVGENRGNKWLLRDKDNQANTPSADFIKNDDLSYSKDGNSFTINIGHMAPEDGYEISYYAEINKAFKTQDAFYNTAEISGTGLKNKPSERKAVVQDAGGAVQSEPLAIKIVKTDDSVPGQPLKGAVFNILKSGNIIETVTTGNNGEATISGLLLGKYEIVEVTPPVGYEINENNKSQTVDSDALKRDKTVTVNFINKKKDDPQPPTPTTPSTPSEIPPVTPGGGGNNPRTPGGGGNTPNNPGGGGNTPNPPTPPSEHPGEVLAAVRTPEGNVLGAERPAVLGVGRGYTKTEDSRNMWINLALFAIAGLGFCTSLFVGRKKRSSR